MKAAASTVGTSPTIPPVPQPSAPLEEEERPSECAHCGLPLSKHWRPQDGPFCCMGCRAVFELIHDRGFERYYDLRQCATSPPGQLRADSFNWLDAVVEEAPVLPGSSVRRLQLDLQGVHCAACIWLLEQLFRRHEGAVQLRINPAVGSVDMLWDESRSELSGYLREVESFGYRFGPARKAIRRRSRALLIRIGICAAAAMNVMTYSLSYYFGLASDEVALFDLLGKLSMAGATIALLVGGSPFILSAWRGIRRGIAHLDLPIAVGIVLAFAGSTWAYLVHGPLAAYYDTITIFITLMLVGRWLQERVVERNRNTLLSSAGVADLYARRFDEGLPEAVPVSEIEERDELWIAPGDLVPVDSILLHRSGTLSLDWITGEAAPVDLEPGGDIPAGAFNAGTRGFRVTAKERFSGSRLNDLIRGDTGGEGEARPAATSGVEAWWNRVASIYVLGVFVVAALGFVIGLGTGLQKAIETSVAILVVTCPCALGLGLPLGRELAHARLRGLGVLLRDDSFLDRVQQVRKIVFDKTGTLTRGELRLEASSEQALASMSATDRGILQSMASRSNHPVSRCVAQAISSRPGTSGGSPGAASADGLQEVAGQGLVLGVSGREYRFGRPEFVLGRKGEPSGNDFPGVTFGLDGRELISLAFEEDLRPDACSEVKALEDLNLSVHLFSGDNARKVSLIAEKLGLASDSVRSGLSPEEKAAAVRALDEDDTLMVGDGLNDSLSFDAALCTATPAVDRTILPQKADFYFLGDGISAVRHAILMAGHLQRVQKGNLVFAALYNALAVSLCLMGVVSPVVAAILMPLSSVTVVVLTSHRLGKRRLRWTS